MIKLKDNKGITMIALGVTILIIVIIATTLIYNSYKGMGIRKLNNMQNDIELLENKVASYYVKNGNLPILNITYTDIDKIKNLDSNDNDKYYVIDLSLLNNLTLNYGKGYNSIKNNVASEDVYVVNEQSHNIYYTAGVNFDGIMYYTK